MRARNWWCGVVLLTFHSTFAWSEEPISPAGRQITSCPTVLPAEEGERSIVVPTTAQYVDLPVAQVPLNYVPHVATRTLPADAAAAQALLKEKLVQRDQLQHEIASLRESTQTPEQILVRVKLLEVNLTKLRQAGVDLSAVVDGKPQPVAIAALLDGRAANPATATPTHNYANYASIDNAGLGIFAALEQQGLGRVLANPQLVVVDGRAASINVGGQVPIHAPSDSPTSHIEFGTKVEITATCLGNNRVRLAVHPRIAELDSGLGIVVGGKPVPATRVREIDFASEVEFGKSALMSGLVQERTVSSKSGWSLRKSEEKHEIALVVVVTPELLRK
jgi:Flp pilus assembly secretin CpaC